MANIGEILNKIDLVHISESANINPDSITKAYKLQQLALFNTLRAHNPHLRANEIAKQMGTSSTTLRRMRDDVNMASPYRYIKSKNKPKTSSKESTTNNPTNNPTNIQTLTCNVCQRVCKSKAGLATHIRSCVDSAKGGVDIDLSTETKKYQLPPRSIIDKIDVGIEKNKYDFPVQKQSLNQSLNQGLNDDELDKKAKEMLAKI